MLTGEIEGRFLEFLVFLAQPRLVLEIGTYSGYSALSMAQALPDGGRIVTCELARRARRRSPSATSPAPGMADRIEVRRGPALETIATLDGPFDLVFIDADKPGYLDYYEAVLPKLSDARADRRRQRPVERARRAAAGPTTTASRRVALRAFNDHVAADERVVSVMLTVRDGDHARAPGLSARLAPVRCAGARTWCRRDTRTAHAERGTRTHRRGATHTETVLARACWCSAAPRWRSS